MKSYRHLSVLLLILALLMVVGSTGRVLAETTLTLPEVLAELKQEAARTETLQSHFVQEKTLAMFDQVLSSEGVLYYQAPDNLRWELLTPTASGFIIQGSGGVNWNSVSGQIQRFSVEDDPVMGMIAGQLLAWTRMDMDWLEQRYRLELVASSPVTMHLYPLDAAEAGFITRIKVTFAPQLEHVAEVVMEEQQGDSTRLHFVEVTRNQPLGDGVFMPPAF